jgi:protoporphyrinogen oxidase
MKRLLIIGGGITGLAAAYLAVRQGRSVTVLEGSPHLGGLLRTFPVGGNELEFFYHHFFTHDAELRWLLRDLGIEDRLEFHDATMGVFRDGTIYPFNSPKDLLGFAPLRFTDKMRFAASSLFLAKAADWRKYEDISALDWFRRHAGARTTAALWKPMLDVKFGPYAGQVPVAWMIGRLRQRMNSRQRGDEKLGYLRGSLKELLTALETSLRQSGVELQTKAPAEKFIFANGSLRAVQTPRGNFEADEVLLTLPTPPIVKLLQTEVPEYAARLAQVKYFGAVCTVLEMSQSLGPAYWLNIADPGFPFGGVIEHTKMIPPAQYQGTHLLYLSRYFAADDPLAQMPEAEIEKLMLDALQRVYPHFSREIVKRVHVFRTPTAAVVCDLGCSRKVPACRTPVKNLFLANMAHIYPDERSCNNSIRVAAEACRVMGMDTSHVPKHASLSGLIGMD